MFNFNKIKMNPSYTTGFKPAATETQITELEEHCGHVLPESYKEILKNYNGGTPESRYFDVIDKETGVPLEWKLSNFYYLDDNKNIPDNIWWLIEKYSYLIGENTLPFADDGVQQFYYMKWVDDVPQVWFLAYLDLEEPEAYMLVDSFDHLLGALYASD